MLRLKCFFISFYFLLLSPPAGARSPKDSLAYTHLTRSKALFKAAYPDSAFRELRRARSLFQKNDSRATLEMKKVLADYYAESGLDTAAIPRYLSLLQSPVIPDSLKAEINFKLATIHFYKKDYLPALKNDSAALTIYSHSGKKIEMADSYLLLAMIRQGQHRLAEAEHILLKLCLPLYSYENAQKRGSCFIALGKTYLAMSRTSEAKWFFIQANLVARNTGDRHAVTESLIGMARVKIKIRDYNLALTDLQEAVKISREATAYPQLAAVNYCLYDLYKNMGNDQLAKTAYSNYQRYQSVHRRNVSDKAAVALRLKNRAEQEAVAVAKAKREPHLFPKTPSYMFLIIVIIASLAGGIILFIKFRRNRQ